MNENGDPRFVVIAGDWHGNLKWALHVIDRADELFTQAGEACKIVIQLGDFGFCPIPNNRDLQQMSALLVERGMMLWWIDGNHDYHPHIEEIRRAAGTAAQLPYPIPLALPGLPRIRYLPRGTRWTWADRTWLAVGGATSVDQLGLTEGANWWPEEEITAEEESALVQTGSADVLLSHDCPDCWVPFDKMMPLPVLRAHYPHWIPMLPQARAHSARLERIARSAGVSRMFHGHYHVTRDDRYSDPELGDVRVTGLTYDGDDANFQLVDVERVCGDEHVD